MRLARAMKRKMEKQAATGDLRAAKSYIKARKAYDELSSTWKAIHDGELSLSDIFAEYERIGKRVINKTV